jgi:hypothetical protein
MAAGLGLGRGQRRAGAGGSEKEVPDRPQKIVGFCVGITLSLSPSLRMAAGLGLGRG